MSVYLSYIQTLDVTNFCGEELESGDDGIQILETDIPENNHPPSPTASCADDPLQTDHSAEVYLSFKGID